MGVFRILLPLRPVFQHKHTVQQLLQDFPIETDQVSQQTD